MSSVFLKNFINDNIELVYVINVRDSIYRYNHIIFELSKVQIDNFQIIKAVTPKDIEVKEMFANKLVNSYPPCFRCSYKICDHKNNFLNPIQVANFLSFKLVMNKIIKNNNKFSLILEDDFYFKKNFDPSFKVLNNYFKKYKILECNKPVLVRIGSHTQVNKTKQKLSNYINNYNVVKNSYNMANPGFIVNIEFAKLFVEKFKKIETTSDNYIHKILCEENEVINLSLIPFPIRQKSYGEKNNTFKSEVVDENSKENLTIRNADEYKYFIDKYLSS